MKNITVVIGAIFGIILTVFFFQTTSRNMSLASALTTVSNAGYTILTTGEFNTLNTKLDNIKTSADAAVIAAQNAVIAAQIAAAKVDLFNSAEVFLFPDSTAKSLTITTGLDNAWSSWTEVTDNTTTTFSSKFTTKAGYLAEMLAFEYSAANQTYQIEVAFGASKTVVGRQRFYARANAVNVLLVKSALIPASETVYYRATCQTGLATFRASFRYFYQ